jgi:hypothetical protein
MKEENQMATLEQVEKLREKANVSFEEAKAALDACDGDLLEALIYLEKQGKVMPPVGGGYYSSQSSAGGEGAAGAGGANEPRGKTGENFSNMLRRFGRFCGKVFNMGNTNYLEGMKNGEVVIACPVTAVVLLLIFFFWIVLPLFILSLFFGFRYRFTGYDLGKESVNKVMEGVSEKAEEIKKSFTNENK